MTTTMPDDLARALDGLVRGVPGVKALYRSTSLLGSIAGALRPADADDSFVLVDDKDEALAVTVTIAAGVSASITCCAVHDAIVGHLLALGYRDPVVRVTVGQILE